MFPPSPTPTPTPRPLPSPTPWARAGYERTARTVRFLGSRGEQRQRRLIDEFFSGIKAGRVVVLEEQEIEQVKAGELTALVTSALPLTEEEKAVVSGGLAEQLGQVPAIEFRIDPAILGGLVIRLGDKVINGSVGGRLEALRESLA